MPEFLLDTGIATDVIKRQPRDAMGVFNANAGHMAISAITPGEWRHGAEKSAKVTQCLAVVEELASLLEVLPCTAEAAQHHGAIRRALEHTGRPIGLNDLHIATHARSEGLTLVTYKPGEFERVPGLPSENRVANLP